MAKDAGTKQDQPKTEAGQVGTEAKQQQAAADAAQAASQEKAAEKAEAKPKKAPAKKKPAAKKTEGTAAAKTKVDKAAAEEAVSEGASEATPKNAAAKKPAAKKPAAKAAKETESAEAAEAAAKSAAPAVEQAEAEKAAAAPKAPAATPRARRGRRGDAPSAVTVRAHAKYVRSSARKARLVADHVRGKSVEEARAILAFSPRSVSEPWRKLLESAIANAEHNHDLVGDDLRVLNATADEGPTLKRFQPRAMGRATRIRKRTSHLTITLTPKE
jgi:ribosomal protein L22